MDLKTVIIAAFHILFIAPATDQLQPDHHINNVMSRVVYHVDENYGVNVSTRAIDVIRAFQPESIVKSELMRNFYRAFPREEEDTRECISQVLELSSGLSKFELWAVKMLDSSSKIPSGVLIGNLKDLGVYDECVSVEVEKEDKLIRGRHCMYSLSVGIQNSSVALSTTLSICLPAACSAQDVTQMLQYVISTASDYPDIEIGVKNVRCSPVNSEPLQTGEVVTITLLSLFLCFLVGCTVCDILIRSTSGVGSKSILNEFSKFSFYTNAKRIFDTTVPRGNIPAVQGIRFFSMCWVVLGHEYVTPLVGALINTADIPEWMSSWHAIYILIAPFAVDTFFTLSGFLTAYLFMKEMSKGRKFNLPMYYIHRYIRLTPAMATLILLAIYVIPRLGSGPLWNSTMSMHKEMCEKNWWPMLLYVHNYVNTDYMGCLTHTWYLAVDMHFFWVSPLILYPLAKKPRIGLIILSGFIVASIITPAVIAAKYKYSIAMVAGLNSMANATDMMRDFYMVSHTRAGPWLLGVLLGYLLSKKNQPRLKVMMIGWILAILAFAFLFFTYRIFQREDYEWDAPWEVFYAAVSRHIWAFGVCWLIYASVLGYGGFVGQFLSLPVFIPFGRISYCVYLVHFIIQIARMSATRVPTYFTDGGVLYSFFAEFVVSIIGGLALSLTLESPFMVVEKMIFGRNKSNRAAHRQNGDTGVTNGVDNEAYVHDNVHTSGEKQESINV